MSANNVTGNMYGPRQGSIRITHTYPVSFNTTGIGSAILVDTLHVITGGPAVLVDIQVMVNTPFNAVTTNVLTVGTSTTANEWITASAVNEALAGNYPSSNETTLAFSGHNGAGACTATGVVVGDRILSVTGVASGTVGDQSASFESVVSVNDQIQQTSVSNLSANVYLAVLQRGSSSSRFRITADTPIYVKYTQTGTAATAGQATIVIGEVQENAKAIA